MRLSIFNSLTGLCVATAVVSCSDALVDNFDNRPVGGEASDMISFVVADQNNATRGGSRGNRPCGGAYLRSSNGADSLYLNMEVSDIADEPATRAIGEFSSENKPTVLHMSCRLRNNDSEKPYRYYFKDTEFSKGSGDIWSSNPAIYWFPEGTHYNFFGYYAPKEAETLKFNGNGEDDSNSDFSFIPKLEYTVPEDLAKHIDLAYSLPKPYENIAASSAPESVPVTIKHALTKIILKTGSNMADGVIESVSFTDVKCRGKLNIGTVKDPDAKYDDQECEWTLDDSTQDFTLSGLNVKGNNQDITPAEKCFMLLPESATANSKIVIMFRPEGTLAEEPAKEYKLTLSDIPNLESWKAGKCYTYTINIKPEVGIVIEDLPEYVDAHYVMHDVTVNIADLPTGASWELSASTSNDKARVTLLPYEQLNKYHLLGYWMEERISSLDATSGEKISGEPSLTSAKTSQKVRVFIPENTTTNIREIKLSLTVKDSENKKIGSSEKFFFQHHPAWVDNNRYGWEMEDESSEAEYGFYWTGVSYYWHYFQYTHQLDFLGWIRGTISGNCNSLIQSSNAQSFAEAKEIQTGTYYNAKTYKYCIIIDYSKLSDLTNLNDYKGEKFSWVKLDNDGYYVTKSLYSYAGLSTTGEFEEVLEQTLEQASGIFTDKAFTKATSENYPKDYTRPTDNMNFPETPAIGECLKKNKFYLYKDGSKDEGGIDVENPYIRNNDIVWYLPAKDEFSNYPSEVSDLISNGDYWSSTFIKEDSNESAYDSKANPVNRLIKKKVIACRIHPTLEDKQ